MSGSRPSLLIMLLSGFIYTRSILHKSSRKSVHQQVTLSPVIQVLTLVFSAARLHRFYHCLNREIRRKYDSDMAMAGRLRSGLPLINRILRSESLSASGSAVQRSILCPAFTSQSSKSFATASRQKEDKVKVPIAMFGGTGKYASALYLAAKKANALNKVEAEILDLLEASKNSPTFSQFTKDLSVPAKTRVKAITDICTHAKFSETTKNFLVLLAENGRLRNIDSIVKKFVELTMADRGEVKATVTTVIPLPPAEEEELKVTLQEIIGQGKTVKLEKKIDPSIYGGLVVEFSQKVFDMSIKTRAEQMERFLREPVNISI